MERSWIFGLSDRQTLLLVLLTIVLIPAILVSWPSDLGGPTVFLLGCYLAAVALTGLGFVRHRDRA